MRIDPPDARGRALTVLYINAEAGDNAQGAAAEPELNGPLGTPLGLGLVWRHLHPALYTTHRDMHMWVYMVASTVLVAVARVAMTVTVAVVVVVAGSRTVAGVVV